MANNSGESVSPWRVPLLIGMCGVLPWGRLMKVMALVYRVWITFYACVGKPNMPIIVRSLSWLIVLKAEEKSTKSM